MPLSKYNWNLGLLGPLPLLLTGHDLGSIYQNTPLLKHRPLLPNNQACGKLRFNAVLYLKGFETTSPASQMNALSRIGYKIGFSSMVALNSVPFCKELSNIYQRKWVWMSENVSRVLGGETCGPINIEVFSIKYSLKHTGNQNVSIPRWVFY